MVETIDAVPDLGAFVSAKEKRERLADTAQRFRFDQFHAYRSRTGKVDAEVGADKRYEGLAAKVRGSALRLTERRRRSSRAGDAGQRGSRATRRGCERSESAGLEQSAAREPSIVVVLLHLRRESRRPPDVAQEATAVRQIDRDHVARREHDR